MVAGGGTLREWSPCVLQIGMLCEIACENSATRWFHPHIDSQNGARTIRWTL